MQPSSFRLDGRIALVTHVARPLAMYAAMALAAAGAHVVAADPDQSKAEATAVAVTALGRRASAITFDETQAEPLGSALSMAGLPGPIHAVVNAAALPGGPAAGASARLAAAYRMAQDGARVLTVQGIAGAIINLALRPPNLAAGGDAAIVETGIVHLTRSMAVEFGRGGMRVNCLLIGELSPAAEHAHPARVALGRQGHMGEIEGPLLLLASCAGSYMTGCALAVDGGALLTLA